MFRKCLIDSVERQIKNVKIAVTSLVLRGFQRPVQNQRNPLLADAAVGAQWRIQAAQVVA